MGGKKKAPEQPAYTAPVDPVVSAPTPTASKAMNAQPTQTAFGGAEAQANSLFASNKPGMAQAAQLAKKYLLGQ